MDIDRIYSKSNKNKDMLAENMPLQNAVLGGKNGIYGIWNLLGTLRRYELK